MLFLNNINNYQSYFIVIFTHTSSHIPPRTRFLTTPIIPYPHLRYSPITVGSRSTNTALGTCFPVSVSAKKVLKESSPPPNVLSFGILPSGCMSCSRQYSSQQAFPICVPACPTWTEIHSR